LDAGPSRRSGGNLFCKRDAHAVEIHMIEDGGYVVRVNGLGEHG
jgi:hypothetical protein